jgi:hypothetical protein
MQNLKPGIVNKHTCSMSLKLCIKDLHHASVAVIYSTLEEDFCVSSNKD